jgi:hypothetical protein
METVGHRKVVGTPLGVIHLVLLLVDQVVVADVSIVGVVQLHVLTLQPIVVPVVVKLRLLRGLGFLLLSYQSIKTNEILFFFSVVVTLGAAGLCDLSVLLFDVEQIDLLLNGGVGG